ncbi:type II secretion system minor pseudopilin GspH [Shewanella waksmanii]|uniref:type II secretion system minor pseudopilin GspH n=1 Tax=Shewanella waksmanii TaxID=213783 RepID=UPI003736DC79
MHVSQQRGFTLLEVLLVALLMGLTAAAVTLSLSGADRQQELNRLAKQFMATTEMALDETVLSGQFVGIVVDDASYEYVIYDEGKWKPLQADRMLTVREMEYGIELDLLLEGLPLVQEDEEDSSWFDEPLIEPSEEDKKKFPEPQIMLFPSGEMSSFELRFITEDQQGVEIEALVVGDTLGRMTLGRDGDFDD